MESIKGYKYATEQLAQDAVDELNVYYADLINGDDENWAMWYADEQGFWFIMFVESLRVVLGDPTTFEIT